MKRNEPIPASFWWQSAGSNLDTVIREFLTRAQKADRAESGHDCGHRFEITVRSADHAGIVGGGPASHIDGEFFDGMEPGTVRAHNLRDALLLAAALPLSDWFADDEPCAGPDTTEGGPS